MEEVRQNLKNYRNRKGLTIEGLAEKVGMSRGGYYALESGKNDITLSRLFSLSKALDVSVSELFGFESKDCSEIEKKAKEQEEFIRRCRQSANELVYERIFYVVGLKHSKLTKSMKKEIFEDPEQYIDEWGAVFNIPQIRGLFYSRIIDNETLIQIWDNYNFFAPDYGPNLA